MDYIHIKIEIISCVKQFNNDFLIEYIFNNNNYFCVSKKEKNIGTYYLILENKVFDDYKVIGYYCSGYMIIEKYCIDLTIKYNKLIGPFYDFGEFLLKDDLIIKDFYFRNYKTILKKENYFMARGMWDRSIKKIEINTNNKIINFSVMY